MNLFLGIFNASPALEGKKNNGGLYRLEHAQIAEISGVTDDVFNHFYLPSLNRLEEYLGHTENLVQSRIQRVIKALKIRRRIILPAGTEPHLVAEKKDLWTYAVFLSSLFYGIDKDLNKIKVDCPLSGGVLEYFDDYNELTTVAIATSFTPKEGLAWLWNDPFLWNEWLGSLTGMACGSGDILRIVSAAIGQEYVHSSHMNSIAETTPEPSGTDSDSMSEVVDMQLATEQKETKIIDESDKENKQEVNQTPDKFHKEPFLNWLKDQLQSGSIQPGTESGLIYPVETGWLLKSPEIFHEFTKETDEEWNRVQNRFLRKKLHKKNEEGANFHVISMESTNKKIKGILLGANIVEWLTDCSTG